MLRAAVLSVLLLPWSAQAAVTATDVAEIRAAVWVAYYSMQRQRDGSWRANGCRRVQPARTIPT